jgi:hypothetical protein
LEQAAQNAENCGAGWQGGVGLGAPAPRAETKAGAAVFRLAEPVFGREWTEALHSFYHLIAPLATAASVMINVTANAYGMVRR